MGLIDWHHQQEGLINLNQPFSSLNQELKRTNKAVLRKIALWLSVLYLSVNEGRITSSTTTFMWNKCEEMWK